MGVLTSSFKPRPRRLLSLAHRCLASRFSPAAPSSISRVIHSPAPSSRPSFPSRSLLRSHSFSPLRLLSTHYHGDAPGGADIHDNNNSGDQFVSCSIAASADSASDDTNDKPPASSPSHRRQLDEDVDAAYQSCRTRFRLAFEKRVLDWQDVRGSLDSFPYYLNENTRDALVDCTAAHLWQPKFASFGFGLPVSSRRICLCGPAGSELYKEKLVEALAKHLKASLLVLDSTVLSPHDYGDQEFSSESEGEFLDSEVEHVEGWSANGSSSQDALEDQDAENESSRNGEFKVGALLEFAADSVEGYKQKLLLQERKERRGAGHEDDDYDFNFRLRKGDRVKYVGSGDRLEQARQMLKVGQKGRIVSVPKGHTGKVGVQFESDDRRSEGSLKTNEKLKEIHRITPLVGWCDLSDLEPDGSPHSEEIDDWLASAEALCEMAPATRSLVVFFPDPKHWFERAVPSSKRKEFLERVEAKLDQIEGPIVLIASRTNEEEVDYDDKNRLLERMRSRLNMKSPAPNWTVEEVIGPEDIYELFVNTIKIYSPQDEQQLREWRKRLQHDKELCNAKRNLQQLQKVLELHNMDCAELSSVDSFGLNLTDFKAEKVVGWARNHHLGLCLFEPFLVDGKLMIPHTSMERAIARMREQEKRKARNLVDYKAVARKALFSAARKLSPAVTFLDEMDNLLGARGGSSEHEATRKTHNEFMAAGDGLKSNEIDSAVFGKLSLDDFPSPQDPNFERLQKKRRRQELMKEHERNSKIESLNFGAAAKSAVGGSNPREESLVDPLRPNASAFLEQPDKKPYRSLADRLYEEQFGRPAPPGLKRTYPRGSFYDRCMKEKEQKERDTAAAAARVASPFQSRKASSSSSRPTESGGSVSSQRDEASDNSIRKNVMSNDLNQERKPGAWKCSECTFLNLATDKYCYRCQAQRGENGRGVGRDSVENGRRDGRDSRRRFTREREKT